MERDQQKLTPWGVSWWVRKTLHAVTVLLLAGVAFAPRLVFAKTIASCGANAPTPRARLCGQTILVGRHAGVIRVLLAREAVIRLDEVKIHGNGRFLGFLMMEDRQERDGDILFYGVIPAIDRVAVDISDFEGTPDGEGYVLPKGSYRLYFLADGKRAKVVLPFEALEGSVTLQPTQPAGFAVREPTPRFTSEPTKNVYSSGDVGVIRKQPGLVFRTLWVEGTVHLHGQYGTCLYAGEPQGPTAYAPSCPGASLSARSGVTAVMVDHRIGIYSVTRPLPPGEWGQGLWYAAASLPDRATSLAFWLTLE